jgi:hypothetical protein
MVRKDDPDPAAAALAKKRWTKVPKAQRSDHARKMAKARWESELAISKISPERRKEIAKKAAEARWRKKDR